MRRVGTPPLAGQSYRTRAGVYGLILHPDGLLLTEQADPGPEVQLPGGGIDPGESPVPALSREALEETGWSVRVLRRLGAYQRYTYMPEYDMWARKICHIYLCRTGICQGLPREPGHEAMICSPEAAVSLLGPVGDALHVANYFDLPMDLRRLNND